MPQKCPQMCFLAHLSAVKRLSIRSWIKLFQSGAESCILQNGLMSDFFQLGRGCRQGDPISPYIFILCVEVLGIMIRKSEGVKGIKINNRETAGPLFLCVLFAICFRDFGLLFVIKMVAVKHDYFL